MVVGMLAMIAIPAAFTLLAVHELVLQVACQSALHTTLLHYKSLSFVFPVAVIAGWFLARAGLHILRRAFWRTIAILSLSGFMLDFAFAQ
jgi:hypothetical protein